MTAPPNKPRSPGNRSTARLFAIVLRLAAIYGLASILVLHTPVTEYAAQPLLVPSTPRPADAIVVLGSWASESGELNEAGLRRSIRAADLYRDGYARVIVVTGAGSTGEGSGSAPATMAGILRRLGVPEGALVIDQAAENTYASGVNVAALARRSQWSHILVVSDAMHMRRAAGTFERQGLKVTPVSTSLWDLGGAQPSLRVKRVGSLVHEYVGLAYYWWRGWI